VASIFNRGLLIFVPFFKDKKDNSFELTSSEYKLEFSIKLSDSNLLLLKSTLTTLVTDEIFIDSRWLFLRFKSFKSADSGRIIVSKSLSSISSFSILLLVLKSIVLRRLLFNCTSFSSKFFDKSNYGKSFIIFIFFNFKF